MTLFPSTSSDTPTLIHISFDDPKASLGVQLVNCDTSDKETESMFIPGYAVVGRLLPGETVASKAGVRPGDCIIAVNGHGFRRFKLDPKDEENMNKQQQQNDNNNNNSNKIELDHAVIPSGTGYQTLLTKIKAIKAAGGDPPLIISLERHGWDSRANGWYRFLAARDNSVPLAMQMIQEHEMWKEKTFPIELKNSGLQKILRIKAVSEIDHHDTLPTTVYVNYGALLKLQTSGDITAEDVVNAFVIFTERMLAKANDPRHPSTCQFIDLSGVSITSGFRADTLKQIYNTFEPNYPETLYKMVIYPVSSIMSTTARTLLSFVNEKTKKKFLITNSLDLVCTELGWDKAEVEECGGVTEFMHKHEKAGDTLLFDTTE